MPALLHPQAARVLFRGLFASAIAAAASQALGAQDAVPSVAGKQPAITACYDPTVGALYLIKLPGLAEKCLKASHVELLLRPAANDSVTPFATGPAGGDLAGAYPDPVVVKLQSQPINATVPTQGQALFFTAGAWKPVTPAFTGDVTGGVNTMKVVKLQNNAVAATAPTNGQVLQWDATGLAWKPATPPSGVTVHGQLSGLTADDHLQYLRGDGVRATVNGFAVTGNIATGALPASGPGVRMLWFPGKAAFRAGGVSATEWDAGNIGDFSSAFGYQTTASGPQSSAFGQGTRATGTHAMAMGFNTWASGNEATAMGGNTIASGNSSTAMSGGIAVGPWSTGMGLSATANGAASLAMGESAQSNGYASLGGGVQSHADGVASLAFGDHSIATGNYSLALGATATAGGHWSVALGKNTTASGNNSFALGDGSTTGAAGVGSFAGGVGSQATGAASMAFGSGVIASGANSAATGFQTVASADFSTAMGDRSSASGPYSTAIGSENSATGWYSTAMGIQSSATFNTAIAMGYDSHAGNSGSVAIGSHNIANGTFGLALGVNTEASGDYSTAMGYRASTNGQRGSFVWGDNSSTSLVTSTAGNEFALRAAGGVRLRTKSDLSTGCDLAANSGVWSCTSSKTQKTDFADVAGDDLLARLHDLPVQTWRYKGEDATVRHMGPYAEDFRAAFRLGTDSLTIGHIDLGGVSLAAAKALEVRTRELRSELAANDAALSAEARALRDGLEARDREIAALRMQLAEMARLQALMAVQLEKITKGRS